MPKERRDRSVSLERSMASPFPCSSSSSRSKRSLPKNPLEREDNVKEWEDARCPVCMEHPHNAILLICSSHDKGCRPYMCDTSHRHSNCFDQFKKSSTESPENEVKSNLVCPLCRGGINGWVVVEGARVLMNAKLRSCSCETCDFKGIYGDLRKHARLMHPLVRPSEADPERERNWRRLQQQMDLGDLISTLQSSSTGGDEEDGTSLSFHQGGGGSDSGWGSVVFLIRVFPSGSRSGTSRATAQITLSRRRIRPEETNHGDDDNESSDGGHPQPTPDQDL